MTLILLIVFASLNVLFSPRRTSDLVDDAPDFNIPIDPDTGLPEIPYDESVEDLTEEQKFQNLLQDLPYKGNGYKAERNGNMVIITYSDAAEIYRQGALLYLKSFGLSEETPNVVVQQGQV